MNRYHLEKRITILLFFVCIFFLPGMSLHAEAEDDAVLMQYVIMLTTNKEGVGSKIYLDNNPIIGFDSSFEEHGTIPSEEGLLIHVGDDENHLLFLRKVDANGNYVDYPDEPIRFMASKANTLGLHIPWGGKKKVATGYSLDIRTMIDGQLLVDGVPRANLRTGEVFTYEFSDKRQHWLQIQPSNKQLQPIGIQVSSKDRDKGVLFSNNSDQSVSPQTTIPKEYLLIIGVAAIILICALVLFFLLRKKDSYPAGVEGPILSGGTTKTPWPEYMRINYPHLEPIEHFRTGGMSNIWIVKNMHKDNPETYKKKTAIKILHEQFNYLDSPEATRFMDEALILKVLEPTGYVPKVYARSAGKADAGVRLWFELEYLEEYVALRDKVGGKAGKQLSLKNADQVMHVMTLAVLRMHEQGVVHRDLSPENVMVKTSRGKWDLKLLDFGISKALARNSSENQFSTEMTTAAELLGKAKYSSPEQRNKGLAEADQLTDR